MRRQSTNGTCNFCGQTFGRIAMRRHVLSCPERQMMLDAEARKHKPQAGKLFQLLVEGDHATMYWLQLDVRGDARLKDLDRFLRDIWLECCGHLSAFEIGPQRYSISPMGEYGERNLNATLGTLLRPKVKFRHEYDFGTTTELVLTVISERDGDIGQRPLQLLARNEPPLIPCGVCGKPATITCA
ncbi:MAG: hypothetical protein ABI874_07410, partial [Chloroflexota bacterium]